MTEHASSPGLAEQKKKLAHASDDESEEDSGSGGEVSEQDADYKKLYKEAKEKLLYLRKQILVHKGLLQGSRAIVQRTKDTFLRRGAEVKRLEAKIEQLQKKLAGMDYKQTMVEKIKNQKIAELQVELDNMKTATDTLAQIQERFTEKKIEMAKLQADIDVAHKDKGTVAALTEQLRTLKEEEGHMQNQMTASRRMSVQHHAQAKHLIAQAQMETSEDELNVEFSDDEGEENDKKQSSPSATKGVTVHKGDDGLDELKLSDDEEPAKEKKADHAPVLEEGMWAQTSLHAGKPIGHESPRAGQSSPRAEAKEDAAMRKKYRDMEKKTLRKVRDMEDRMLLLESDNIQLKIHYVSLQSDYEKLLKRNRNTLDKPKVDMTLEALRQRFHALSIEIDKKNLTRPATSPAASPQRTSSLPALHQSSPSKLRTPAKVAVTK